MNLANLPTEEKDAMELNKQLCLARHYYKRMDKVQFRQYLQTVPRHLREHIERKIK